MLKMLRAICVVLTVSMMPMLAGAAAFPQVEAPRILVLGDSLSAGYNLALEDGWVALLQTRLAESGYGHEVVNASITGDTTRGGLARITRALELHRPSVVIIELGGNDGLRGIPVPTMRENLTRMASLAREAGAHVVLMGVQIPMNYGSSYREAFEDSFRSVAESSGAALVPSFMEGVALDETLMQRDGIHPNAAGQPRLLENMWPALIEVLDGEPGVAEP